MQISRNNLGHWLVRQEQFAETEQLYDAALGERHPRRGRMLFNLAVLTEREGNRQAALTHSALALELVCKAWGDEHPQGQEFRLVLEAVLAEGEGAINPDPANPDPPH